MIVTLYPPFSWIFTAVVSQTTPNTRGFAVQKAWIGWRAGTTPAPMTTIFLGVFDDGIYPVKAQGFLVHTVVLGEEQK